LCGNNLLDNFVVVWQHILIDAPSLKIRQDRRDLRRVGACTLPEPWEGRCEEHGHEPETGKARRRLGGRAAPRQGHAVRAGLPAWCRVLEKHEYDFHALILLTPHEWKKRGADAMRKLIRSVDWELASMILYGVSVLAALAATACEGSLLECFR
jgi:hypothetical protein